MSAPSSPRTESSAEKLEYVDAMRGLAFLAVLVAHASTHFPAAPWKRFAELGFYGVQLFFVVSAFTLFLSCEVRFPRDRHPVRAFFVRRFFRLAPMFWLGALVYTFLPGRDPLIPVERLGWVHYLTTLTFTHAWHPQTIDAVVPGGWSIGVEWSFYLILPLMWKYLRTPTRVAWFILASTVITLIAARVASVAYPLHSDRAEDNIFLKWWLLNQLGVFGCGILLFHLGNKFDLSRPHRSTGLLLLTLGAFLIHALKDLSTARFVTTGLVFGFSSMLLGLGLRLWPILPLVNRLTRWTGTLSYSCYLSHFLVLELAAATWQMSAWQKFWPTANLPRFVLYVGVAWALTLAVSAVTYRFIEEPGIALGRKMIRKWQLS